jgi:hypothetical protein
MTVRGDLHRPFADRFHAGKRPRAATQEQILEAEIALGVLMPEAYRQFARNHGAFTARLLRGRMTPAELKRHDAAYPFSLDDGAAELDAAPDRGGTKGKRGSRSPRRRGR